MKIFFVFYEDPDNPSSFPLGIGLLSGILKKRGHTICGQHVHNDLKEQHLKELLESIVQFKPDILAYSCTSPAFKSIAIIARYLRKHYPVPGICGGAQSTLYPKETLAVKGIDYICVGEGERSFAEFIKCIEKDGKCRNIPGIFHLNQEGIVIDNQLYCLQQNLDNLAWTDYDVFGKKFIEKETSDGWLRCITSRGCPYNCSYCHTPMFRKVYSERIGISENKMGYVRFRSIDSLLEELVDIVQKYDLKVINFMDDLFCLKKKRTLEFCKKFKNRLPKHVGYSIQTHLDHLDAGIVTALYESRCQRVVLGIESGSQRILDLFNRKTNLKTMKEKLVLLVKTGFPLGTWSLNILGNPGESVDEMLQTLSLNGQSLVERIKINILAPYPKSKIYDYCVKHNLFHSNIACQDFQDRSISKLKFPAKERAFLEKFFDIGHWYLNLLAPLNLENYYRPLVKEVEKIGPGEWQEVRAHYLRRDQLVSELCRQKHLPFYHFIMQGKVYSNVIGLSVL